MTRPGGAVDRVVSEPHRAVVSDMFGSGGRQPGARETQSAMAGNVATATADADAETASLLPRASTVGATSRRGGRTVAVVAAVTAVAAVSLGGISGSPHLAARLGALLILIRRRPGDDTR